MGPWQREVNGAHQDDDRQRPDHLVPVQVDTDPAPEHHGTTPDHAAVHARRFTFAGSTGKDSRHVMSEVSVGL